MACVQSTTPAKQHSVDIGPRTFTLSSRAVAMADSSRTSTAQVVMRVWGKRAWSSLTEEKAWSGFRSQRARPDAPCSRRAAAAARARAPAPPVTVAESVSSLFLL
jgi:hypothetical protein